MSAELEGSRRPRSIHRNPGPITNAYVTDPAPLNEHDREAFIEWLLAAERARCATPERAHKSARRLQAHYESCERERSRPTPWQKLAALVSALR